MAGKRAIWQPGEEGTPRRLVLELLPSASHAGSVKNGAFGSSLSLSVFSFPIFPNLSKTTRTMDSKTGDYAMVSGPSKTVRLTTSVCATWGPWRSPLGAKKSVPGWYLTPDSSQSPDST